MTVIFSTGYTLPGSHQPTSHARILHRGKMRSTGTYSASSTETGYSADAPGNALTYERWKPTGMAGNPKWAQDMNVARNVECCGIAAHTLGSNGCGIRVQYSTDNVTWVNATNDQTIETDDPIFFIFANVSARYWRINITGTDPDIPEIGVCRFGSMMQMDAPIWGGHSRLDFNRKTVMRSNYSETGEVLGRTKQRQSLATSFEWAHISSAWIDDNWLDFLQNSETEPFFIAWRPDIYGDVGYVEVTDSPQADIMGINDLYSISMNVRGYLGG